MTVTDLKIQKNNAERCNLYIDGQFYCGINAETAVLFHIKKGMEISRDLLNEMLAHDGYRSALNCALAYASRTANKSRYDFEQKLSEYPTETVDSVLLRLEELGYINDAALAENIVSYGLSKNEGPLLIRQRLMNKHIDKTAADDALDKVSDLDFLTAAKKCGEDAVAKYGTEDAKSKAKVFAAMQRRGFTFDMITEALGELED